MTSASDVYSRNTPNLQSMARYAYATDAPHPNPGSLSLCYTPAAYSLQRPQESLRDRAMALLEGYKKESRSGGIIEAVTNTQQKAWEPVLEEFGFIRGAQAVNSNSNKTITVWLLAYGAKPGTGALDPKEV
jgi:hypothetical protein